MELSLDAVRNIADLAKLDLTDEEIQRYTEQLSGLLAHFEKLQALETSHIAPTASVLPLKNVLRADVPQTPLTPESAVANAPDAQENQFRVSAVLDE